MFYSKMTVAGEVRISMATEDEAIKGGQQRDMVPQVFYRIKGAMTQHELDLLPSIDTESLFDTDSGDKDTDQLTFTIQKQIIPSDEIMAIRLHDSDREI